MVVAGGLEYWTVTAQLPAGKKVRATKAKKKFTRENGLGTQMAASSQ